MAYLFTTIAVTSAALTAANSLKTTNQSQEIEMANQQLEQKNLPAGSAESSAAECRRESQES